MDRQTLLWTLVLFFGASLAFSAIKNATEDESMLVALGAQVLALGAIVAVIVLAVRRSSRD